MSFFTAPLLRRFLGALSGTAVVRYRDLDLDLDLDPVLPPGSGSFASTPSPLRPEARPTRGLIGSDGSDTIGTR